MSNNASKAYQFNIVNGVVVAVSEVKNGRTKLERMERDESWSVQDGNVIKTEMEHGRLETTTYSDVDGDGLFLKVSKVTAAADGAVWAGQTDRDHDDKWKGSNRDDHFDAGLGQDDLFGGAGNDDLYGAEGNDRLSGDVGSDDLHGGDGDDVLSGGSGSDDLYGGLGDDVFKINSVTESGVNMASRDRIFDFETGDKIDLSNVDAKLGTRFNDAFVFIGSAAKLSLTNANGAVWFENGIVYGSNDRDLDAEFQIEVMGVQDLAPTDFIL